MNANDRKEAQNTMGELEPTNNSIETITGDAVTVLRNAIGTLLDDVQRLADEGDWEGLVRGLEPLQQIIVDLRIVESAAKRNILELMPSRMEVVEGVGSIEKYKKVTRRNWQSDDLLRAIVRNALVDQTTGEIPSSPMEAVDRVITEIKACVPFTGSTAWRVTALRDRGFDLDEWCEQNFEDWTLRFNRDKSNG